MADDDVLNVSALFSFLPWVEQREAHRETETKFRELRYLLSRQPKKYEWVEPAVLDILLTLGVFYRRVIAPSDGAIRFVSGLARSGATSLEVGRDRFSSDSLTELNRAVLAFSRLTGEFGLTQELLATERVEDFLFRLKRVLDVH